MSKCLRGFWDVPIPCVAPNLSVSQILRENFNEAILLLHKASVRPLPMDASSSRCTVDLPVPLPVKETVDGASLSLHVQCGRMSQDEHPTEVRTCTTQGENKGRKQQPAPTERHCADKTLHTKREQDKISILRGSQNIPPDWDSPQDTLETL